MGTKLGPYEIQSSLSPQEDRVALQIDNAQADIWVLDLARGVRTRLTVGPVAVWSPKGKWIASVSRRNGHSNIYRKPSDGGGTEELLLTGEPQQFVRNDWSRDGKYLIYSRGTPGPEKSGLCRWMESANHLFSYPAPPTDWGRAAAFPRINVGSLSATILTRHSAFSPYQLGRSAEHCNSASPRRSSTIGRLPRSSMMSHQMAGVSFSTGYRNKSANPSPF
ncbi:MAG: PD40 domain-containing protein [Acidobacteria bacterium]|nr:PD40 domain-containing protein [Acidobacteriota bacterium]